MYYAEVLTYSSRFIDDALALIGITHYFDTVLYMRYYKNIKKIKTVNISTDVRLTQYT